MALAGSSRFRTVAVVAAVAAVGVGFTVRRQAKALRANELAQQQTASSSSASATTPANSKANSPNLYVSVDRSGGGI